MVLSFDQWFFEISKTVALRSKDRSTQLGCVIVGKKKEIVSVGYNSFPRGINDFVKERHERPLKYDVTAHAEENAVVNCTYNGRSAEGCSLYLSGAWTPCATCSRLIINSGIAEVVIPNYVDIPPRWAENFLTGLQMMDEASVKVRLLDQQENIISNIMDFLHEMIEEEKK